MSQEPTLKRKAETQDPGNDENNNNISEYSYEWLDKKLREKFSSYSEKKLEDTLRSRRSFINLITKVIFNYHEGIQSLTPETYRVRLQFLLIHLVNYNKSSHNMLYFINRFVEGQWAQKPFTILYEEEIIFLLELIKNTLVNFDVNLTDIRNVYGRDRSTIELRSLLDPHFANDAYAYVGTLLHVAAMNNMPLLTHWLAKNNVELLASDSNNNSALFQAILSPNLAAAMALLEELESKGYNNLNLAPLLATFLNHDIHNMVEKNLCLDFFKKILILSGAQFYFLDAQQIPRNIAHLLRKKNRVESHLIPALKEAITHFEIAKKQPYHQIHFFQQLGMRSSQKQLNHTKNVNIVNTMLLNVFLALNEIEKEILQEKLPSEYRVILDDISQEYKKSSLTRINDLFQSKPNLPLWSLETLEQFLKHPFHDNNNNPIPPFSCHEYVLNLLTSTNNNIRCYILEYCEHLSANPSLAPGNN